MRDMALEITKRCLRLLAPPGFRSLLHPAVQAAFMPRKENITSWTTPFKQLHCKAAQKQLQVLSRMRTQLFSSRFPMGPAAPAHFPFLCRECRFEGARSRTFLEALSEIEDRISSAKDRNQKCTFIVVSCSASKSKQNQHHALAFWYSPGTGHPVTPDEPDRSHPNHDDAFRLKAEFPRNSECCAASGPSQHATMRRAVSPLRILTTPVNLTRVSAPRK